MTFKVKHRVDGKEHMVYAVSRHDGYTFFLFFEDKEWKWINASKYQPVVENGREENK